MGNFRKTAEKAVIKIVDNLHNPFASKEDYCRPLEKNDRQMNEIKPFFEEYDLQENKSRMFFMSSKHTKNILIKLTYHGEQTDE
jgi:phosphopantothenate synthetase